MIKIGYILYLCPFSLFCATIIFTTHPLTSISQSLSPFKVMSLILYSLPKVTSVFVITAYRYCVCLIRCSRPNSTIFFSIYHKVMYSIHLHISYHGVHHRVMSCSFKSFSIYVTTMACQIYLDMTMPIAGLSICITSSVFPSLGYSQPRLGYGPP